MQPNFIDKAMVERAYEVAKAKNPESRIPKITYGTLNEGKSLQVAHTWPYSKIHFAIKRIHTYAKKNNLKISWPHHEIYLNDPRRTDAERLQTIIRFPVKAN